MTLDVLDALTLARLGRVEVWVSLYWDEPYNTEGAFTLEVRADNAAAVHVYEKLGFRTVGRLERFFRINGQYHAALLMELDA